VAPVTTYGFDAVGNLTTITRPLNRVTRYDYDQLNRRTKETQPDPDGSTGPLTSPVTNSTFDAIGNLTIFTDALGRNIVYAYDRLNRRTSETLPGPDGTQGTPLSPVTQWAFDVVGNLVKKTDALNKVTTYEYDVRNRLEYRTDPDPDGPLNPGLAPHTKTVYDAVGNVTSTEVRQSAIVKLVTAYTYDNLNRLKSETDAENRITTRTYNTAGLLWKLTDPRSLVTEFQYNDADWLTKEIDPTSAFSETKYNLVGLVSQQTDRRGKISEFSYDALNRLTSERWLLGATGTTVIRTINTTYDNAGRLRSGTEKDQSGNKLSTVISTYDSLDRPTIVENTGTPGVPATVMTYGYDAVGNQTSLSTTVGGAADFVNVYSLDALNRVTRIDQVKAAPTASTLLRDKRIDLFYNSLGQYTRIDHYEDTRGAEFAFGSVYSYDDSHRLTGLYHFRSPTYFSNTTWTFDAAGRITGQTSGDGTVSFANDKTSQLTGADFSGQTDETYTYDAAGNRTNAGYATYANSNRILNDGTYSYEYDLEGNRRKKISTNESTEYAWDRRQRLTTVTLKNADGVKTKEITYQYDAFDRRISKDVDNDGSGTIDRGERYAYDGDDIAFVFTDADGAGTAAAALNSRMLNGVGTDELFADEDALGEILWTLDDHQGTVRDVLDFNTATNVGKVVNHIKYDSFGNILSETNPATGNPATAGRIGAGDVLAAYTGREWDGDADLYYYRARWYDPKIGRFLSEDPQGFDAGDVNLTRYVGNSPWNYTDPSGMTRSSPLSSITAPLASYKGDEPSWRYPWDPKASWNVDTTASLWLSGTYVAATETMRFGQGYGDKFVTQGSTAGSTLWSSGGAMGDSIGTHASTMWYDPAEEWMSLRNSATSTYNGVYNLGASLYNNPGATASSAFNSSVDYLDRFTSDPKVSGEFLGNGARDTAIFAVTAGAGNAIKGTQTFQTVASKFDNVVDAVKSTRLEVYRIPYDPTKLNSSINPTGMGIRRTTENAAQRAKDAVGAGSGGVYGTRVHTAFEKEIKALGNANLSTEVSYKNGTPVSRGTNGSVRLDVVEGPIRAPTNVFDLKTGSAKLTPARMNQIQQHVPGGTSVPIHEVR